MKKERRKDDVEVYYGKQERKIIILCMMKENTR